MEKEIVMSRFSTSRQNKGLKRVAVLAASVLAFSFVVPALAQSDVSTNRGVSARHFRGEASSQTDKRFVPANGAQIMGGFAGVDDLIDNATGETRHR